MNMKKQLITILSIGYFFVANLNLYANEHPAEYFSANEGVYFETVSLSQFKDNLTNLAIKLRGKQGELEVNVLGDNVKKSLGFNPFKISELKSAGIKVDVAVAGGIEYNARDGIQYSILIPASNSSKAFDFMKKIFQKDVDFVKKRNKNRPEYRRSIAKIIDIEPQKMFQYIFKKNKYSFVTNIFVAKNTNFIFISNNKSKITKSMQKMSSSIQTTEAYKKIKKEFRKNYSSNNQFLFFVMNKKFIEQKSSRIQFMKEIEENTLAYGGYWGMKNKSIDLIYNTVMNPKYMQQSNNLLKKIMQYPKQKLVVDFINKNPLLFLKLKVNWPVILDLVSQSVKNFKIGMQAANKDLKPYKVNFENDILKAFTGNFSILLNNVNLNKSNDPASYEGYIGFSLNANKIRKIKSFIQFVKKKAKKEIKIIRRRMGRGYLFTFIASIPESRSRYNKRKKSKPKKYYAYLYLEKSYGFITTSKKFIQKAIKAKRKMKNSKNSAFINILDKSKISQKDNVNSLFYIDIKQLIKKINQSPFKFLAGPYLGFFSKISGLQMTGIIEENISSAKMQILLK